jgi:hypothetical protein
MRCMAGSHIPGVGLRVLLFELGREVPRSLLFSTAVYDHTLHLR